MSITTNRAQGATQSAVESTANRQLTLTALTCFALYGAMAASIGPTLLPIAREFGASLGEIGTIFASTALGFTLVTFLAGYAADRVGKKAIAVSGLIVVVLGMLGMALAPGLLAILLVALVFNIGFGFLESSVGALIADLHPRRRASAINLLHASFGAGALLGPLYAGAMVTAFNWRWSYLGLGLLFAMLVPLVLKQRFPANPGADGVHLSDVAAMLSTRLIALACLAILLYVAAETSVSAWTAPYLELERGYSTMLASLGVSLFWGAVAIGRLGSIWLLRWIEQGRLIQLSALLAALGTLAALGSESPVLIFAGIFVIGMGAAPIYPTIVAVACGRFPHLAGSVTGAITTATGIGVLLGPPLVGRVGDIAGLRQALLGVVILMVAIVAIYQCRDTH